MATLTRSNSRVNPVYKDYVNFLASYKNGKKEENLENGEKNFSLSNSDSGVSVKNFSLANSSNSTSSSSLSSDVTDFSKNSCTSYSNYLESSKTKKFNSVKVKFEEKREDEVSKTAKQTFADRKEEKTVKKSEIFIEIESGKPVSEVSKIFETQERKPQKSNKINSRISIFEKQTSTENKPKLATKPVVRSASSLPKIDLSSRKDVTPSPRIASPPPVPELVPLPPKPTQENPAKPAETQTLPPPPPPIPSTIAQPKLIRQSEHVPAPPPMPSATLPKSIKKSENVPSQPAKIQATLTRGPQTKYSVNSPNGGLSNEIDRNDPLVRKLVYGTLRGLYGAYHDKASDMLATLPKNMVVRSNGVQDRIEQIAANGDLDKLNGRVNPKLDQE